MVGGRVAYPSKGNSVLLFSEKWGQFSMERYLISKLKPETGKVPPAPHCPRITSTQLHRNNHRCRRVESGGQSQSSKRSRHFPGTLRTGPAVRLRLRCA